MKKKVTLELEALSVESFATTADAEEPRGTVHAAAQDCTCKHSCLCETAYYYCGTGPATIYSCDYTANRSCVFGAE